MATEVVRLKAVAKSYDMGEVALSILKGIDLTIEAGDFVAIMGPSGSGKSTLMNILGLLDVPTSGSYLLNGEEVSQKKDDDLSILRREQIGFIFQQFNLLARISAAENVALPLVYSKKFNFEGDAGRARSMDLLGKVDLTSRSHHRPNQLSGGQQQRVAIARSLINNPKIILADEPTGNLDSKSQDEIISLLRGLNDQGITIIIVTHEEEVAHKAKRIIRLRDGIIQSIEQGGYKDATPVSRVLRSTPLQLVPSKHSSLMVELKTYVRQGINNLVANKIRSFLSTLGILIGVAAVVAMLALGQGAQKAMQEQLMSLGSNLLIIRPGVVRVGGVMQDSGAANRLSIGDIEALRTKLNGVKNISAQVGGRVQVTSSFGKNWNTQVQGNNSFWEEMHNSKVIIGRFFTEDENMKRSRVAVIGETVRRELFGEVSAIGEMIKINKVNFQVVGILPEKGGNSFRDQDDVVIIPLQTAMRRLLGRDFVDMIEVEMAAAEGLEGAMVVINDILMSQHRIPIAYEKEAFIIRNMAEIQQALENNASTMSLLLSAIAAISLLVGGIGIMNIMLVSVTERTREIGLRKAVGARRGDILAQFLSESVVISVLGGVCGILVGWLMSFAMAQFMDWSVAVSWSAAAIAFFFSALIGIIFGVYPARKASQLNPIEALRYE